MNEKKASNEDKVKKPPIKIQGIKTKIIPYIKKYVCYNENDRWVEPFLGSGSVAFNLSPKRALLCDTNKHIINFYKIIQDGKLTNKDAREYLQEEGENLKKFGEEHYYKIRDRFNKNFDPLDFLFLNRSCYNGLLRFNQRGEFNSPFCKNESRFREEYINKICDQILWVETVLKDKDWVFKVQSWEKTLDETNENDLIYCDPPYVGRFSTYHNKFTVKEADNLAKALIEGGKRFVFSMWYQTCNETNEYVNRWYKDYKMIKIDHFYNIGSKKEYRNEVVEVLIFHPDIFRI